MTGNEVVKYCKQCGAEYLGKPTSRLCPDCLAKSKLQQSRKYTTNQGSALHAASAGEKVKDGDIRVCPNCGKEFVVDEKHGHWRFCDMFCCREWMDKQGL